MKKLSVIEKSRINSEIEDLEYFLKKYKKSKKEIDLIGVKNCSKSLSIVIQDFTTKL